MPSPLGVRRTNEALANARDELFEIAKVYPPRARTAAGRIMLAITSGGEDLALKA